MNSYDVGDLVRLTAAFTVSSSATDPTTTTCKVREPDGTVTTLVYGTDAACVRSATGSFYVDWSTDQEGVHSVRWIGTGAAQGAAESQFNVRESLF